MSKKQVRSIMPTLEEKDARLEIIVRFKTEDDRREFCRRLGLDAATIPTVGTGRAVWWPKQGKEAVHE